MVFGENLTDKFSFIYFMFETLDAYVHSVTLNLLNFKHNAYIRSTESGHFVCVLHVTAKRSRQQSTFLEVST